MPHYNHPTRQQLNRAITQIDRRWQQQQAQIDLEVIDLMRLHYFYGQVWSGVAPACVEWIIEGTIEEVSDAQ